MRNDFNNTQTVSAKARALKGGASALAFAAALLASPTLAAVCPDQQNIAYTCDGPVTPESGTFENNASVLSAPGNPGVWIQTGINISTFTNAVNGIVSGGAAVYNEGTIGTLDNLGFISLFLSSVNGIENLGTIQTLNNRGTIDGSTYAIKSTGMIGALDNSGFIKGTVSAIKSEGGIGTLTNSGTIEATLNSAIWNVTGTIDKIENTATGKIIGDSAAIYNDATINSIINAGTLNSPDNAIYSYGFVGLINNSGEIKSDTTAITNGGSMETLVNSGTINSTYSTAVYNSEGTIGTIENAAGGTIFGGSAGIYNSDAITTITNNGTISSDTYAIYTYGTIGTLTNGGTIISESYGIYNDDDGEITTLNNSGTIEAGESYGIYNSGAIETLTNEGTIISGEETGVYNSGMITTLNNSGEITGVYTGIYNDTDSEITTLTNTGTITGGPSYYGIANYGGIATLVNRGTIDGDGIDISNDGAILSLTNAQGGTAAGAALVLSGNLPEGEYIAHITSPTEYGQLNYVGEASLLNSFGLTEDSKLAKGTYEDVLSGILDVDGELTGTLGRMLWTLTADAEKEGVWDLVVELLGPDVAKTLLALGYSRDEVLTALRNRAALMNNALATDCGEFGSSGVCLNFNLRRNALAGERETSGTIAASVRLTEQLRVGAFAQLPFNHSSGLVGVKRLDKKAIFGGFVGYSQQAGGAGLQARISAATNSSDLSIARPFEQDETEGGTGTATVKSWGMGAELGYGFSVGGETLLTPYLGLQHISVTRKGYTEAASDTVEFPLTYADYGQRNTTARTGIALSGKLASKVLFRIGGGLDFDLSSKSDAYAGTSTIEDMTTFSLNNAVGAKKVRANGSVELGYQVMPGMAITAAASLRGEAFSDKANSNISLGFRFGF